MAKKSKGLLAAAMAFAASPQGRRLLQQAKEYAGRPENKQRAQDLMSQARSRRKARFAQPTSSTGPVGESTTPPYGTPSQS
jgi:hypothetical protein